ncbi:hypothetical protein M433DRAFT_155943 [Acidomyces richmondensis BFW]|nr:MAG: hypothetical protein FE78DRAFT_84214 [Acidomyces sp. 'richmondensis']KYG44134.1 hypothetical protein M433DRAFT_155943 [Acidomyces richmondensis BFW]
MTEPGLSRFKQIEILRASVSTTLNCRTPMDQFTIPTEAIIAYDVDDWRLQPVRCRAPGPGELLIQMVATGVCHTDLANVGGIQPRILGHEGAGTIWRKGSQCDDSLSVGDPVLLSFAHCRRCHMCTSGHPAHCRDQVPLTIEACDPNFALSDGEDARLAPDAAGRRRVVAAGYFGHSSFSRLALVKESSVVPVKDLIESLDELKIFAPLGCGIQTGACSVVNVIKPKQTDCIAIFGLGGVGLSALIAAKAIGVQDVIAVDILPSRLELAMSLGSTYAINSSRMKKGDLIAAIRSLPPFTDSITSPFGPAGIVDTTGRPEMLEAALASVNRLGRVVQLANQGPGSSLHYSDDDPMVP